MNSTTREKEVEVQNLIVRLRPLTRADFEVPDLVYRQIMKDNDTRKHPIKVSYDYIRNVMYQMREAGTI